MEIREALESDLDAALTIHREAFGEEEEAELVRDLLADPSAKPLLSLMALKDDRPAGHVLFTRVGLEPKALANASILCPLAVVPAFQGTGVGGALIRRGIELLAESGTGLVFVLGHPGYYPGHGFEPAGVHGFEAPYPIAEENAGAWMVRALAPGLLGNVRGRVVCAEVLDKPEYWVE